MLTNRSGPAALTLAFATLIAVVAASTATAGVLSRNQVSRPAGHCKAIGKGTRWTYKGRKGTLYTVEGNRAAACSVGVKWLVRLTNISGAPKTPPGWNCITAVQFPGQCETKAGAIFEWNAKL
jgi:hypothetical protein